MKNLLKALHQATGEMADPVRNANNPHSRNRYADLSAVLESIEKPLQNHGLVMIQVVESGATVGDPPKLKTQLWHVDSAEMIESSMLLVPEKATPQGYAACTTYYRRLMVKSMFGLAEVDDDGNEASGLQQKKTTSSKPSKAPALTGPEIVGLMMEAQKIESLDEIAQMAKQLPDGKEKEECRQVYMERKAILGAK